MGLQSINDLPAEWNSRVAHFGEDHRVMDEMVGAYFGELPEEFSDYFAEGMHVHVINMLRMAWDDLSAMSGKVFPILVRPDSDKPTPKARAEKQEQIGYGYNEAGSMAGGISMKLLMKVLSWWMVGTGNAVPMVLPSYREKTPFFTFRDPRTYFPPIGWSPYTQAEPEDSLFAYQLTIGELKARYPEAAAQVSMKTQRGVYGYGGGIRSRSDEDPVWVGEYYHPDTWMTAVLEDSVVTINRSDTGDKGHPGVNPALLMSLYSPSGPKGRSMFADQISIQAALARMFSQKLDFFDRTLYPLIFHTPISGNTIRYGPYASNEYALTAGVTPKIDTVAPAHPIDADQTMAFVIGLNRMLNRNPEQMQGQGEADSAKAVNELMKGITATVRDGFWPPMIEAVQKMYWLAAQIDVNVWPYEKKTATGKRKNSSFRVPYTPARELAGRIRDFRVEPGMGLAGYQGTVEILQMLGAETISEDTALEQLEDVDDPQGEKRRIFTDRLQKVMFGDLAGKAQMGALVPGALAEIRNRTLKGEDPYDVIADLEARGGLVAPPPELPMGPEAGPPAPGGAPPAGGPPSPDLEAIRRLVGAGTKRGVA